MDAALVALSVAFVIAYIKMLRTERALKLMNKNQIMLMLAMGEMAQQLGITFNFKAKGTNEETAV